MFKFIELLNNNNALIVRRLALYCFKLLKKKKKKIYIYIYMFCTTKFPLNVLL